MFSYKSVNRLSGGMGGEEMLCCSLDPYLDSQSSSEHSKSNLAFVHSTQGLMFFNRIS